MVRGFSPVGGTVVSGDAIRAAGVSRRGRATNALRRVSRLTAAFGVATALCLASVEASAQPTPDGTPPPAPPPGAAPPSNGPRIISDWNEGEPVPPGYHPVQRTRKGLVAAGAALFGSFWLLSALVAAGEQDAADLVHRDNPASALYIPAFGPFIQMGKSGNGATENLALALDGVVQAGGIAMFIYGLTTPKTVLIRNDLGKPTILPTP
jgi:hypothetical protein